MVHLPRKHGNTDESVRAARLPLMDYEAVTVHRMRESPSGVCQRGSRYL